MKPWGTETMIGIGRVFSVVFFTLAGTAAAHAQSTYKCSSSTGVYYSDRPCPVDAKTTSMTPTLPQPVPTPVAVDSRTGHLAYLSGECRQMNDSFRALQSSQPRGRSDWELHRRQVSDAVERYRGRCLEEERAARRRVAEADRAEREQQRARLAQREAEQQRAITEKDQCMEMRGIRQAKRQKLDTMSPGERSDFERFESAFKGRCEGVVPR